MGALDPTSPLIPIDISIPSAPALPQRGLRATLGYDGDKEGLDNATLASKFGAIFEEADNYRARFLPEMQKAYLQYNGDVADRGRAEWQSVINIPLPFQAVSTTRARIVDSLFSNDDFFDILPYLKIDDAKTALAKNVIKWLLWKSGGRERIGTAVDDALICGSGYMKVFYDRLIEERTVVDREVVPLSPDDAGWTTPGQDIYQNVAKFGTRNYVMNKLRLDVPIPTDVWKDPTGRGEYMIHRSRARISDLWDLCEDQKDASGNVVKPKVYDRDVLRLVTTGPSDPQRDAEASVIRRDTPITMTAPMVDVYEFWGNFRDPATGVLLYSNCVMTFVNKTFLIRRPETNPYRHRMLPFVVFSAANQPHQVYPYGILKQGLLIHDAVNRHTNVTLDKQMLNAPMAEADPQAARNPEQLMGSSPSIKPGKILLRKSADKQILYPVTGFAPPTQEDFAIVDRMKQEYASAVGANEFVSSGVAGTPERKTKEEVQTKTQAGQQVFNAVATHIEQAAISPLLKMIYFLAVQYEQNFSDQTLAKMVGDDQEAQQFLQQIAQLDDASRWEAMYLDAEFRCTGISMAISRQDKLNRLTTLNKIAAANPYVGIFIDNPVQMRLFLQLLDLPKDVMVSNWQQMMSMVQNAQIQQMMNPQQPPSAQGTPGSNQHNTQEEMAAGAQPPQG